MTMCQHSGCPQLATHMPCLMVPAKGWPIEAHQPIQFALGVKVCLHHAKGAGAAALLERNPKLVEVIKVAARAANPGGAKPDFERAWIDPLALDGARYAAMAAMMSKTSQNA